MDWTERIVTTGETEEGEIKGSLISGYLNSHVSHSFPCPGTHMIFQSRNQSLDKNLHIPLFPPPVFLKYNWHIILCKFKVYIVMVWYAYILQNVYRNKVS